MLTTVLPIASPVYLATVLTIVLTLVLTIASPVCMRIVLLAVGPYAGVQDAFERASAPGGGRWQDGAATANNPAVIAVQEARLLWPDVPIECLVSLGCGTVPLVRREKSMSAYLDTGSVLIESACGVTAADVALRALCPLIPGLSYFR